MLVKAKPTTLTGRVDKHQLIAAISKASFYDFVRRFWHTVIPEQPNWNWHIKYICDQVQRAVEKVMRGEKRDGDMVINVPPGSTKSTLLSVMLPAWVWTKFPTCRFIGASYAYPLALDLSLKTRDIVTSELYKACFPHIRLRDDQNTKGNFKNTLGGYRYAVGVNGSVLGMHGHLIVIDDPLDPNQAVSPAQLALSNHWIKETLGQRKVDSQVTLTILVMQRLHQDDPTTLFLERKNTFHICIPSEITPDIRPPELEAMYVEGVMDPKRFPRSVLDEKQLPSALGEHGYAAQFLQTPVPAGGAMFKVGKINRGQRPPDWNQFTRIVRYWDKAGTAELPGKKNVSAFTVGTKMGVDVDGRFWVLDVVRGRWDSAARERVIRQTADRDGWICRIGVEQEPGSGGKDSARATLANLAGYRCFLDKVDQTTGGKINRADPWATQLNGGNVYVVEAEWTDAWIMEHKYFPHSKFKDQVDSTAGAFAMVAGRRVRVGGIQGAMSVSRSRLLATVKGN